MNIVEGYIGVILCAIFFGINYAPLKFFNIYKSDTSGIFFQFMMSIGIMAVGVFSLPFTHNFIYDPYSLLGGGAWALANGLLTVPIVNSIGIGTGLLVWAVVSLIVAYFTGRYGFGTLLLPEPVSDPVYSWLGLCFSVLAFIVYGFLRPTDGIDPETGEKKKTSVQDSEGEFLIPTVESLWDNPDPSELKTSEQKKLSFPVAFLLACLAGVLYGLNLIPFKYYVTKHPHISGIDYLFSQASGIFVTSFVIFLVHTIWNRNWKQEISYPLPSITSGLLWGFALVGWLLSISNLGFATGFVLSAEGPLIVNTLMAFFVYKELSGRRNIIIMILSWIFLALSALFLVLAHPATKPKS